MNVNRFRTITLPMEYLSNILWRFPIKMRTITTHIITNTEAVEVGTLVLPISLGVLVSQLGTTLLFLAFGGEICEVVELFYKTDEYALCENLISVSEIILTPYGRQITRGYQWHHSSQAQRKQLITMKLHKNWPIRNRKTHILILYRHLVWINHVGNSHPLNRRSHGKTMNAIPSNVRFTNYNIAPSAWAATHFNPCYHLLMHFASHTIRFSKSHPCDSLVLTNADPAGCPS